MTSIFGRYLLQRPAWMAQGKCIEGVDPDLFFPKTEGDKSIPEAKAICRGCPVAFECLTYAVDTFQMGIWGGLTDLERKELHVEAGHQGPVV